MKYIKGEPRFNSISDEKLESFLELFQDFIFVYQGLKGNEEELIRKIWEDCKNEKCVRAINKIEKEAQKEKQNQINKENAIIIAERSKPKTTLDTNKIKKRGRPKKEVEPKVSKTINSKNETKVGLF